MSSNSASDILVIVQGRLQIPIEFLGQGAEIRIHERKVPARRVGDRS
jgi:hypothetical protein